MTELLTPDLTHDVLRYLGVSRARPNLALLNGLLLAYGQTVPWGKRLADRQAGCHAEHG